MDEVHTEDLQGEGSAPAEAEAHRLLLLPESRIGEIEVVRLLGCGKVSEAWFGVDAAGGREVVLKVLRPPWMNDAVAMTLFEKTLAGMATLDHPNLAKVHSCVREGSLLYWTTEWVKGGALGSKIRRKGPMDLATACALLEQAAAGLEYAHAFGVVHGGLKPENLLVERSGATKVSDLGVEYAARRLLSLTAQSAAGWDAEWMAPEVRCGKSPDLRSDIFSLGTLLFYMLTGALPHEGESGSRVKLSSGIRELLLRMLATRPEDRIGDYGTLRMRLKDSDALHKDSTAVSVRSDWLRDGTEQQAKTQPLEKPLVATTPPAPPAPAAPIPSTPAATGSSASPLPVQVPDLTSPPVSPAAAVPASAPPSNGGRDAALPPASHWGKGAAAFAPQLDGIIPANTGPLSPPTNLSQVIPSTVPRHHTKSWRNGIAGKIAVPAAIFVVSFGTYYILSEPASQVKPLTAREEPPAAVSQVPTRSPAALTPRAIAAVAATTPLSTPKAPEKQNMAVPRQIIIDNSMPGAVELKPVDSWKPSAERQSSYDNSSMVAPATGTVKTATFYADIPVSGRYEIQMWWVRRSADFRSASVPVLIKTLAGTVRVNVDQVNSVSGFNTLGVFELAAGEQQPLVIVTNEGMAGHGPNVHLSIDALKLVPLF